MSEEHRQELMAEMIAMDGTELEIELHRESIQEGRTFSAEAMSNLQDQLLVWAVTRIMRRWDQTGEPPTVLRVRLQVTVA